MIFKKQRLVSLFLALIMIFSFTSSSMAAEKIQSSNSSIVINDITYNIEQSYDKNGNKVVTVNGDGETNTIVVDSKNKKLEMTKMKKLGEISKSTYDYSKINNTDNLNLQSSGSCYSMYWNYSYYWNDANANLHGMYWSLCSGNTYGNYNKFASTAANSYAESFRSNVNNIQANHIGATAMLGVAVAGAIAGAITAPTGIGGIVGIVVAIGGSLASVPFWASAYTSSLDANYNFAAFVRN